MYLPRTFLGQAEGVFFSGTPMALYGGTLLNYCVAFSLRKVIEAIYRRCTYYKCMHLTPYVSRVYLPGHRGHLPAVRR